MRGETIRITRNDIAKLATGMSKAEINKAISRGINYALGLSRTRMKRAIQEEYKLPASALVTSQGSGGTLKIAHAKSTRLIGSVLANSSPESIAHFRPVWYRDLEGAKHKGGGGGGFIKSQKRGKEYKHTTVNSRNTGKSGVYFEIVKGKKQCFPGAFMIFKGSSALVVARGKYQNTGQTKDFKFSKPGAPIYEVNKLNAKSVFWGVLHPYSIKKWEPQTEQDMMKETIRQIELLVP